MTAKTTPVLRHKSFVGRPTKSDRIDIFPSSRQRQSPNVHTATQDVLSYSVPDKRRSSSAAHLARAPTAPLPPRDRTLPTVRQVASIGRTTWWHRFRPDIWQSAAQTVAVVLRNAGVSVGCAWFANFCFSLGSVLHGRAVRDQSDTEFVFAALVWIHAFSCVVVVIAQATLLLSVRFVQSPSRAPSYAYCVLRLLRRSFCAFVTSLLVLLGILLLFRAAFPRASNAGTRLEYYLSIFCNHGGTCGIIIAVRRIMREETVQGQVRAHSRRERSSSRGYRLESIVSFWKLYLRMASQLLTVVLAAVYVHVSSHFVFAETNELVGFTLGSLALKLLVQEAVKRGIVRNNVRDPRTMFFAVGLPTVLIDTQVRIALQRNVSAQFTLAGALGLAALEIATRMGKGVWHNVQVRRREKRVAVAIVRQSNATRRFCSKRTRTISTTHWIHPVRASSSHTATIEQAGTHEPCIAQLDARVVLACSLQQWKQTVTAFQVAELYADISAEYIAIGCSTSILFFYWSHPKYELGGPLVDHTSVMGRQCKALAVQVAVEVLVDYVSCVFEIGAGVDFQHVLKHRVFLGSIFLGIAVTNIQISAMIYIREW